MNRARTDRMSTTSVTLVTDRPGPIKRNDFARRDDMWFAIKLAKEQLQAALACHPIENAGGREVHLRAALATLGNLGSE